MIQSRRKQVRNGISDGVPLLTLDIVENKESTVYKSVLVDQRGNKETEGK